MFSGGWKHYILLVSASQPPPLPCSFWIIVLSSALATGLCFSLPVWVPCIYLLLSPFSPHLPLPEELTTAPVINTNTLSSHSPSSLPTSRLWTTQLHLTLPRRPGDVPKQLKTLSWVESSPQTICVPTSSVTAWCVMEWLSYGELAEGYQKKRGTRTVGNSRPTKAARSRERSDLEDLRRSWRSQDSGQGRRTQSTCCPHLRRRWPCVCYVCVTETNSRENSDTWKHSFR